MNPEIRLTKAQSLYHQCQAAGFDYGCLYISLAALGGQVPFAHIPRTSETNTLPIKAAIARAGLFVNWIVTPGPAVTKEGIQYLFSPDADFDGEYQTKVSMGHLILEENPWEKGHVIAVLGHENAGYKLLDAQEGPDPFYVQAENILARIQYGARRGCLMSIAQICR